MNLTSTVTISSREIAELTGKHHAHVMASIRRTFAELGITDTGLTTYIDRQGKPRPCYQLTAEHALITFPSRCVTLMAALVKRIEELQEAAEAPEISTFADEFEDALQGVVRQAEEVKQQLEEVKRQADLKATVAPLNSSALGAFSHTLAPRIGMTHKLLKRGLEGLMDELGYDIGCQSYTFKDAKGREKSGYMLDMELLLSFMTGCNVGRLVSDLMEPLEWEEVCH